MHNVLKHIQFFFSNFCDFFSYGQFIRKLAKINEQKCHKRCSIFWKLWKNNFPIFAFSKFIEIWPKCHHKLPNYWVFLWFCSRLYQNAFQNIIRKKKVTTKNFSTILFQITLRWFQKELQRGIDATTHTYCLNPFLPTVAFS